MIKTSVVIPARNEAPVIKKMVTMLLRVFPEYINEVIVVNDGSTDDTQKIVKDMITKDKRIKLMNRNAPHGVGLAIREGLRHVHPRCTHILTIDADFTKNIPDLFDMFDSIKSHDGVIGSRYSQKHMLVRYPLFKRISNRAFHMLANILYGVKTKDLTNNFKLYKKEIFTRLPLASDGFSINAETGLYTVLMGYKIKEIPVTWYARDRSMGVSKFQLFSVAPGYIRVLWEARNIFHKKKL